MSISSLSRVWPVIVAGALLVVAGCGGGGGGLATPTATPIATPVATTTSAQCSATTFSPNYYGLPEPGSNDTSTSLYLHWDHFPITVYIPSGADAAFRASTLAGFDQWVSATGGRAGYRLVSAAKGADLVVSYSPQNPNSDTLGLTTISYTANDNAINTATDPVKMQLFFYTTAQLSDANATNQSIAAHELGHALGISPHSPFVPDLMYPTLERPKEVVTTRDLNTLKTIYCDVFPTRKVSATTNRGPLKTIVIRD